MRTRFRSIWLTQRVINGNGIGLENWYTIILFRSKLSHQIWHDIVDSYIIPPKHQVSRCSQDQDTNGWPKSRRAADVSAYLLSVHKFAGDFRTQNKFIEKSNEHFIDFVHFSTEGQLDACFPIIRHKVYLYSILDQSFVFTLIVSLLFAWNCFIANVAVFNIFNKTPKPLFSFLLMAMAAFVAVLAESHISHYSIGIDWKWHFTSTTSFT